VVVLGLLCLVAIYFLKGDPPTEDPASLASVAGVSQRAEAPRIVPEERGRFEIVRPVKVEPLPATLVEPLFEADTRVKLGETANLRFAARDRVSGLPLSGATVTASVSHGGSPPLPLKVDEVDDGVFDVPFTPVGPGQFRIALSVDGVVAGSQRVGVVGAVGAVDGRVDVNPLTVDPREPRARTSGRTRRR
jgi:hypothetical protein